MNRQIIHQSERWVELIHDRSSRKVSWKLDFCSNITRQPYLDKQNTILFRLESCPIKRTKAKTLHAHHPTFLKTKKEPTQSRQKSTSHLPEMPCKNVFLNLSRTGGKSVYHFRLPSVTSKEGVHTVIESHPRFQYIGSKNRAFTQT